MAAKRKPKRKEPTARQHSDQVRRERSLKRLREAVAEKSLVNKDEPNVEVPAGKPIAKRPKRTKSK